MSSLREKLKSLLVYSDGGPCPFCMDKVEAILEALRAEVPEAEKEFDPPLHDYEDGEILGWNSAIKSMLERLQ